LYEDAIFSYEGRAFLFEDKAFLSENEALKDLEAPFLIKNGTNAYGKKHLTQVAHTKVLNSGY